MHGIEDGGRIPQKRLFFLLHPLLIGHVRAVVMQLPVVSYREMIRQNLTVHEDEAVLPEITIGRTVVDVFGQIMVGIGASRQKRPEFERVFNLFEIIAAMRPDRPGQNGGYRRKRPPDSCDGEIRAGRLAQDLRPTATRYSLELTR